MYRISLKEMEKNQEYIFNFKAKLTKHIVKLQYDFYESGWLGLYYFDWLQYSFDYQNLFLCQIIWK